MSTKDVSLLPTAAAAPDVRIVHGDCREVLPTLDPVDAVVTDPPYGLSFMGKGWDHGVPGPEFWEAVLSAMKPGAHLLAFGGTRTYHRLACAIEDAGFELRDCLMWLYGTGFPKSMDVSKAIDKVAGATREVMVGGSDGAVRKPRAMAPGGTTRAAVQTTSVPVTDDAKRWEGWGTALKPAWEPILLARRPLEGTVAANVLEHGVGGLNVDGCRVSLAVEEDVEKLNARSGGRRGFSSQYVAGKNDGSLPPGADFSKGRWPANLILDEDAGAMLDAQSAEKMHGAGKARSGGKSTEANEYEASSYHVATPASEMHRFGDSGGASRFFYCAKASKRERGEGNKHPTVKPLSLMRYLCRLVTPPGGTVLDPFMGSGSTLVAAREEGFRGIGIEKEGEYCEIARGRLK